MFDALKSRINNLAVIKTLCQEAENHALRDGRREPGAEDFLLAAFDLPDGTARLTFERLGLRPEDLRPAIEQQYADALRSIGIQSGPAPEAERRASSGLYRAAPSGEALFQALIASRTGRAPLLGAHIVRLIADMDAGVATRALRALNADSVALKAAADEVIQSRLS